MKFLLSAEMQERLIALASASMSFDPYCDKDRGYLVESLYLDTPTHDILFRSETCRGTKYRIRRYNGANQVFLERKSKSHAQLRKNRLPFAIDRLDELDSTPQLKANPASQSCDNWFIDEVRRMDLRPACLVQYKRCAFYLETAHDALRLTVDSDLRSASCMSTRFSDQSWAGIESGCTTHPNGPNEMNTTVDDPLQFVMSDHLVLELKYVDSMPSLFKKLLCEFQIEPVRFSKYRTAMLPRYVGEYAWSRPC